MEEEVVRCPFCGNVLMVRRGNVRAYGKMIVRGGEVVCLRCGKAVPKEVASKMGFTFIGDTTILT